MEKKTRLLTVFSEVQSKPVEWLWYPYIPVGKITLIQGDPGDGKSTMMLQLISDISRGDNLPDGKEMGRPHRVIYQCSEDGAKDTIKPRLQAFGADCSKIAFIDEEVHEGLTLEDERIRQAIDEFRPWLVVIDPVQSYIESESDLKMATKARKLMRRLGLWASTYNCAIVLIGHLNKNEGSKNLYRALGSIDVVAAARSIIQVARNEEDPEIRNVRQIKNNLAPCGDALFFEIRKGTGFRWLDDIEKAYKRDQQDQNQEKELETVIDFPKNKHELAAAVISRALVGGEAEASVIREELSQYHIGDKTIQEVKTDLGIKSERKMRKWYWRLPREGDKK